MGILKKHPTIFLGIGITLLFLALGVVRISFLDTLDYKHYDVMMQLRADPEASSNVIMVEIDDDSIEKLGRWPWPRSLIAEGIQKINSGNPRVIGLNIIYSEPEESEGLKELQNLETLFKTTVLDASGKNGRTFFQAMRDAQTRLDNDRKLEGAIEESGKVVLPAFFRTSAVVAESKRVTKGPLFDQSIQNINNPDGNPVPQANEIILPISQFFKASKGVGHINFVPDIDGTLRRERLFYEYRGLYIPAYTLKLAALYLNIPPKRLRAYLGATVYLGSLEVPTT